MKYDLSICIPARNEMFLKNTVEDILKNKRGKTQIIVGLDGEWVDPPLVDHPDVVIIHHSESIGQRAITNECVRLSNAKYIMKLDAHCSMDEGFDVKMIADMHDDWTMVPTMRNLHAFDWVCKNGHSRYQGPSGPCTVCKEPTTMDIKWIAKKHPQSNAYRFDTDMHFQYWQELAKSQKRQITATMSIQGSCFMVTREKYLELDLCSEVFSSWGSQGTEISCRTWLSGGRVMVNRKTWYAHMFRTQGGDFSFPYPNPGRDVINNRKISKELFAEDKWPKAIIKFQDYLNMFNPPGWTKPITKGALYYTDNRLAPNIMQKCQEQLKKSFGGKIVSVSLKPINFGDNIVLPLERGLLTMSKQILAGLEKIDTNIVFMCEHDVLYHPTHFAFTPTNKDVYYYNMNSWYLRASDGHALYYDHKALSGMCGFRETLITHYKERIRRTEALLKEANGGTIVKATSGNEISLKEAIHRLGFEPGTHNRPEKVDNLKAEGYKSEHPIVDIRHDKNETQSRWTKDKFRNKPQNWIESEIIPFWGQIKL